MIRMFWIASRSRLPTVFLALLALMLTSSACGRADARLSDEVRSRLTADPTTASLRLDVSVTNGVVHLGGETRTRAEQERAVQVVRGTQGIKGVINDLKISDRDIVDNVKTALAADPLVAQVPVTVEAKDGEVDLRSNQTDADQRKRMVQIASKVEGVSHVNDDMK
jgi:osmotically-inducible protein OsmY